MALETIYDEPLQISNVEYLHAVDTPNLIVHCIQATLNTKKTVHIIKVNVRNVAHQLSHRRAAVHATG